MSKFIARLLPLLLLACFYTGGAKAQQHTPDLKLGDAVVTGFSGTIVPDPNKKRPRGISVNDLTFINPDGASARVIDVSKPGYIWDGRLFKARKTFDILAKDVGQVFGVALDDATPPNIYLGSTSVFGLNIVSRGRGGLPERRVKGGPGAGWMKGQFGLDLQGSPGAIYKVDGRTGAVTLFANVTLDGVPNPGPALGNLAYDSEHKQLFVSDLYTGMIHRLDLDGKDLGHYDHGSTGLGSAKLATAAFDPRRRPDIASERFNSEKPDTWDYAPLARQVWGLAVHDGRLYYSVASGPQIWSVGIDRDGGFAADPRWELDVPAQAGSLPVSDIAFSHQGAMILAQRALIAGAYDYAAFTQVGEPRVLRYWLKDKNDPPSPGRWKLMPEEYAVGFAGNDRNTNGGVAFGYGYDQNGALNTGACEAALWSTGQNLRNNPALRSQLDPGGPLVVHGLQGSPANLVRDANTPPAISYFVDYDDRFDDPRASGHMGSVRIFAQPCAGAVAVSSPAVIASPVGGGGSGGGVVNPPPPPPPIACYCPATPIPASGPRNYITNGNFATGTLAGWTLGGTFLVWPVSLTSFSIPRPADPLTLHSPVVPPAAGVAAYFVDDHAVNESLSQSVTVPAGNYEVGFDLLVDARGALNANDSTMSAVIAGVTVLPTVSASSIVSAETVNGVYTPTWKHYSAFFSTCGGTYTASFDFNSFGGPLSGGIKNAAKDFMVDRVYIIDSTTAGTNISCTGSLKVQKEVKTHGTLNPWPNPGPQFPITLACTAPPQNWSFSLNDNGAYTANNIPFGDACTVAEGPMPPVPPNVCPPNTTPTWTTGYAPPSPVIVNGPTTVETITNTLTCNPAQGEPGSLIVKKVVVNHSPLALPSMTFPVAVTCGSTATNLNLSSDGTPQTVNGITTPATCTVQEGTITTPPNACPPNHNPAWTTTYVPPSPVSVTGPGATMTIQNVLDCERGGNLVVTKTIDNQTAADLTGISFPAVVTCSGSTFPTTLSVSSPQVLHNKVIGTVCSVVETLPPAPTSGCPEGSVPTWMTPPTYTPATATIAAGSGAALTVNNVLTCKPAPQGIPACDANSTTRKDNMCSCRFENMVRTSPAMCMCKSGMKLEPGKGCVPQLDCTPPLVPDAAGTKCVCPDGEVLRRGKCVKQEQPKRERSCKRGFVWNGDMCVRKKSDEPRSQGRDVIRTVPGLIPGLGGRGSRGGGGGGGKGGAGPVK